jgi:PIN domain nuclease of toxin-antitoxin system
LILALRHNQAQPRAPRSREAVGHVHTFEVARLPRHHRDPFDRLLIAQALAESVPVLSADSAFDAYPVRRPL